MEFVHVRGSIVRFAAAALLLCPVLSPGPVRAAPATPEDWRGTLRSAIERAVAQNPEVGSMEARIQASRHRVSQANALPDPELEIGLRDVPVAHPSLTRD